MSNYFSNKGLHFCRTWSFIGRPKRGAVPPIPPIVASRSSPQPVPRLRAFFLLSRGYDLSDHMTSHPSAVASVLESQYIGADQGQLTNCIASGKRAPRRWAARPRNQCRRSGNNRKAWWMGLGSNQRRPKPADLQSAPFSHSGTHPSLTRRPRPKSAAMPAVLCGAPSGLSTPRRLADCGRAHWRDREGDDFRLEVSGREQPSCQQSRDQDER